MQLELTYRDRYQLWNDLVRGSTDRLFVPTEHRPELRSTVPVSLHVGGFSLPIVVRVQVVGWRPRSRRFAQGVYVRVPGPELDKCRRFLGLRPQVEEADRTRRAVRVHCETPVRFLEPSSKEPAKAHNVSESGIFVTTTVSLVAGQAVRVELDLEGGPLALDAEVAWASAAGHSAGLHFVSRDAGALSRLREHILGPIARQDVAGDGRPKVILVADDDVEILRFLTTALSKHGYEVHQAGSGTETLEMCRHLMPSLMVLDILMPGLDGADVCRTVRADAELADIPVIFISALDTDALHAVADDAGATDYLTKPVHLAELINLMGTYLV